MAQLCKLCQSIPLGALPAFPPESYFPNLSGRRYLQLLVQRPKPGEPSYELGQLAFEHHQDLESLRDAAKQGCGLCRLIEAQSDALLAELEERKGKDSWRKVFPRFDLWITKRANNEDGISVFTNSTVRTGQRIILLAAFAFCADEGDPLQNVFRGRIIKESPKISALNYVKKWIAACDEHKRCGHKSHTMPTRVVDVGITDAPNSVKLVETSGKDEEKYIALSYCWGSNSKKFTTTETTLLERQRGIDINALPKTLQDAILLTRMLGVRYLWIDSLCICQDHLQEWERESAKMTLVYANAYLTLSATGVDNSNGGLLFSRPTRPGIQLPHESSSAKGTLWLCALPVDKEFIKSYHVDMRSEPLTQRGWCFQERVLSRRILHFAQDQIYFECLEGIVAEDGLKLSYRFSHISPEAGEITSKKAPPNEPNQLDEFHILQWLRLNSDYGRRKLTYPLDKLPAISGVAAIYQELLQDEYIAGMWKKTLLEEICWQPLECREPPGGYRAPSWSWAAVDGRHATMFDQDRKLFATLLDSHVQVDGVNPFGAIKDAWIKISAPLIPLTLSHTLGPVGNILLRTPEDDGDGEVAMFDTINKSFEVSAERIRGMQLYALVIYENVSDDYPIYRSLIVTPTGCDEGKMKRLGTVILVPKNLGPSDLSYRKIVTLV